jgi:phosphopantothenoylcysteine decarboxylase/phosphopantothenate--cysteine ligase
MATLTNKRILLGITGGIAAYKSADLTRRLRDAGAEVRVVMTESALEFITPLTMQAVSGHPVYQQLLDTDAEAGMGHIDLARWADAVLIAPTSANFIARLTQGRAEDLLSTICIATQAPVAIAPAMNQQMWSNAATQENLATLRRRGIRIFGPGDGSQACGEVGPGRMLEPTDLVARMIALFTTGALDGMTVVVTAGPTWEAIDPVRGISNRSSGKMGYAIAEAAIEAGARVILVSGRTALPDPARATMVRVTSAQEMFDAVHAHIKDAHLFIGVAAVADYRPAAVQPTKLKKNAERLTLELVRNPDILESVARLSPRPYVVGFAAETDNVVDNARTKLERKRLDLIVANQVGGERGFETDDNHLILVEPNQTTELPIASKQQLARALIRHIATKLQTNREHRTPALHQDG